MTITTKVNKMNTLLKRFEINTSGRDLVVGDIHGYFTKLQLALDAVGFDPSRGDRLFSVGDLVDRGPDSADVLDWLAQPWFHAVQGNHDDMAIRWGRPDCRMDAELYAQNGGAWNIANTAPERLAYSDALDALPLVIEIETAAGLVGIVHADCTFNSWDDFKSILANKTLTNAQRKAVRQSVLWSRERIESGDQSGVDGVRAVVVGHTPLIRAPYTLGNTIYIDSGAWALEGKDFCLLDAATLLPAGNSMGEQA